MQKSPSKMTIDTLAVMINNGFKESRKELNEVKVELNEKIVELKKEMTYRFDGVQNQLDNIYINYIQRHEHRTLKERVRKIERKVGIPPSRVL